MLKDFDFFKKGNEGYPILRRTDWHGNTTAYDILIVNNRKHNYAISVPRSYFEILEPQKDNRLEGKCVEMVVNILGLKRGDRLIVFDSDSVGYCRLKGKRGSIKRVYYENIRVLDDEIIEKSDKNEESLIGKEVEIKKIYDNLLPGSRGIVIFQGDDEYALRITHAKWDGSGEDDGYLWDCDLPDLFPNGDGYYVPRDNFIVIDDENQMVKDLDYACTLMPWEIEELKKK